MSSATQFEQRVAGLRRQLSGQDPLTLARRSGAAYLPGPPGRGEFSLPFFGQEQRLSFPGFACRLAESGKEASLTVQAFLLYYLHTATGALPAGRWVSFADLPGGRFYAQAFQSYTGSELLRRFGDDRQAFTAAALALGGVPQSLGTLSYSFSALPRLPVLALHWQGDEDFPSSYQLLFDLTAPSYLPIDVLAILGSTLTRRLLAAPK